MQVNFRNYAEIVMHNDANAEIALLEREKRYDREPPTSSMLKNEKVYINFVDVS